MAISQKSSLAARKAWVTRREKAIARSEAAKKAWVTRRAIAAILKEDLEHCSLLPKPK